MRDQAEQLRNLVKAYTKKNSQKPTHKAKILTILSGKGGVGKSVIAANLAVNLSKAGKKVLLLDADVGFANADIILGVTPVYHLLDVMQGKKKLTEVIVEGPEGLKIIAGGSAIPQFNTLSLEQLDGFTCQFDRLEEQMDYIIIDNAGGISPVMLNFVQAADEIIVVTMPEPTAIADAYCMTKTIFYHHGIAKVNFIINRVMSDKEGEQVAKRLQHSIKKFLDKDVMLLGSILDDQKVSLAVRKRTPFSIMYPHCAANQCLEKVGIQIMNHFNDKGGLQKNLFQRIFSFLLIEEE